MVGHAAVFDGVAERVLMILLRVWRIVTFEKPNLRNGEWDEK